MKGEKVLFSSASEEWATPRDFFAKLDKEFFFTLDPCATAESTVVNRFFTREMDGLSKSWAGERVFMNPPYGKTIGKWMQKALSESRGGSPLIVCLVPARTDTRWWHECVQGKAEVRFIRGRLRFGGSKNSAPFPSCIVIYRGKP